MERVPLVTADTLLHGSWSALEQAGRLLARSVTLFDADELETATTVAMLGEGQLRQYRILRALAEEVADGRRLSVTDVLNACENREDQSTPVTQRLLTPDPCCYALDVVTAAVNHYAVERERLITSHDDERMASAEKTMNPPPDLAAPRWPRAVGIRGLPHTVDGLWTWLKTR